MEETTDEPRLRLRGGCTKFSEPWLTQLHFAGRHSTGERNDSPNPDITWIDRVDDYWAVVGRLAARPMGVSLAFMRAGVTGYAPSIPKRGMVKTGTSGDAGRLVAGRAGGGWLSSPDFAPNANLFELRYK